MKMKWDYSYSGTVSTKKDDELFSKVASPNWISLLMIHEQNQYVLETKYFHVT